MGLSFIRILGPKVDSPDEESPTFGLGGRLNLLIARLKFTESEDSDWVVISITDSYSVTPR